MEKEDDKLKTLICPDCSKPLVFSPDKSNLRSKAYAKVFRCFCCNKEWNSWSYGTDGWFKWQNSQWIKRDSKIPYGIRNPSRRDNKL